MTPQPIVAHFGCQSDDIYSASVRLPEGRWDAQESYDALVLRLILPSGERVEVDATFENGDWIYTFHAPEGTRGEILNHDDWKGGR